MATQTVFHGDVLICEDNAMIAALLEGQLAALELSTTLAANGKQAVEFTLARMAQGRPFDLIFMDIHMPLMGGMEAAHALAKAKNTTPLVAFTSTVNEKELLAFRKSGMQGILRKPFEPEDVHKCLCQHLTPITRDPSAPTISPPMEQPPKTHIVDLMKAYKQSGGDEKLYHGILAGFREDNQHKAEEIHAALHKKNSTLAYRLAHTLKSTARMVGAKKLADAAFAIEESLHAGNTGLALQLVPLLAEAQAEVMAELLPFAASKAKTPIQKDTQLNPEAFNALIAKLVSLVRLYDTESRLYVDDIRRVFAPMGPVAEQLAVQIEKYQFEAARDTLKCIRASLEV